MNGKSIITMTLAALAGTILLTACNGNDTGSIVTDASDNVPETDTVEDNSDKSPEELIVDENMVFDYCESTVATVGGDGYKEMVLYGYDKDRLVLVYYSKYEDEDEKMSYRIVPRSALDDCMALVKKYKMRKWNKSSGFTGMVYSIRFRDDGEWKRISSEKMPDNGTEAFYAIEKKLSSYWAEAKKSN